KYFMNLPQLSSTHMQLQHARWVHMLTLVRSQWLALGKPVQLSLHWEAVEAISPHQTSVVSVNRRGWPQPTSLDPQGCQQLWWQLMGMNAQTVVAEYAQAEKSCHYRAAGGSTIKYQLDFGTVIFLTV
ncbi:MAG: MSHA biogenesis protein MshF, partial [Shewanella sp.]